MIFMAMVLSKAPVLPGSILALLLLQWHSIETVEQN